MLQSDWLSHPQVRNEGRCLVIREKVWDYMSYKLRILKVRYHRDGQNIPAQNILYVAFTRLLRFSAFDVKLLFKNDFISDRISVSPKKIFRCNVSF